MRALTSKTVLVLVVLLLGACKAKAPDLSGSWKLNIEKSKWGKVRKPTSVVLDITHQDPALSYHGAVVDADSEGREFHFDGAIDGHAYPVHGAFGDGTIIYQRKPNNMVVSTFHSNDGQFVENAETSVSADGKVLHRHVRLRRPDGDQSWDEVYGRR
jgi:hypothetical protein